VTQALQGTVSALVHSFSWELYMFKRTRSLSNASA